MREQLMQTHLPALLTDDLYYPNGKILDEVYEYGSFLQSKMHAKGVRCSDCHEPHSLQLHREGNQLCAGCHNASAPAARPSIDTSGLHKKNYDSPGTSLSQARHTGFAVRGLSCASARVYASRCSSRSQFPHSATGSGGRVGCLQRMSQRSAARSGRRNKSQNGTARTGVARRRLKNLAWYREAQGVNGVRAVRWATPELVNQLSHIATDASEPAMVRASAVARLTTYPGETALGALNSAVRDADRWCERRGRCIQCVSTGTTSAL